MISFGVKRAKRGLLKRNQWVASIVAGNGANLFTSETYNNRADAVSTAQLVIDSVQGGQYTEAVDE